MPKKKDVFVWVLANSYGNVEIYNLDPYACGDYRYVEVGKKFLRNMGLKKGQCKKYKLVEVK